MAPVGAGTPAAGSIVTANVLTFVTSATSGSGRRRGRPHPAGRRRRARARSRCDDPDLVGLALRARAQSGGQQDIASRVVGSNTTRAAGARGRRAGPPQADQARVADGPGVRATPARARGERASCSSSASVSRTWASAVSRPGHAAAASRRASSAGSASREGRPRRSAAARAGQASERGFAAAGLGRRPRRGPRRRRRTDGAEHLRPQRRTEADRRGQEADPAHDLLEGRELPAVPPRRPEVGPDVVAVLAVQHAEGVAGEQLEEALVGSRGHRAEDVAQPDHAPSGCGS